MSDGYRLVTALVFLFLIINVIKEIVQMAQQVIIIHEVC